MQSRPIVPKKDVAVYGYGSVAWKDRVVEWKKRQNEKLQMGEHQRQNEDGDVGGDGPDDTDLPK